MVWDYTSPKNNLKLPKIVADREIKCPRSIIQNTFGPERGADSNKIRNMKSPSGKRAEFLNLSIFNLQD